ncbi:MAG: hypothetical protein K1X89_31270 [Myxococcaceae bacterium]|nr:hypothetical protein [Myxococcaceae bacterium]
MSAPRRGQSLVLFALTLVVLTLGVLLTLAIGDRVKSRLELQTLADAAAYDQAVAAARTFNSLSVVNRTEWSLLVAESASQAYLSWATLYRAALEGTAARARLNGGCGGLVRRLDDERERVESAWQRREPEAQDELRRLGLLEGDLLREDAARDYRRLERLVGGELVDQLLAGVRDSAPGVSRSDAPDRQNAIQLSSDCERGVACDLSGPGFTRNRTNWTIVRHQHEIFMGTRGDAFVTAHRDRGRALTRSLERVLGPGAQVRWRGWGSSYRSSVLWTHSGDFAIGPGNALYPRMTPDSAFSDDHGQLSVTAAAGACVLRADLGVRIKSGASDAPEHTFSVNGTIHHCENEGSSSHRAPDLGLGQSWPLVIDFNDKKARDEGQLFGQPRLTATLLRAAREGHPWSPWELAVRLEGGALSLATPASVATATSTGIAYYHRGGQWQEPPNFVNPYWHATLVSPRWTP